MPRIFMRESSIISFVNRYGSIIPLNLHYK